MRSWSWQQWLLLVLVLAAAVAVIALSLLGLTAALRAGGAVELSAGAVAWLTSTASVAMFAVLLAIALALAWAATMGVEKRLRRKNASYLQFVGVSVSVLMWAMGQVVTDHQLVTGVLAAAAGIISIGAASAIKRWPIIGISLYVALPLGTVVVADLTGAVDSLAWLNARDSRDLALLGVLVVVVVLVPTVVLLVERHWQSEQWMLGDRFDAWLGRHRAVAWVRRGGSSPD